MHNKTIGVAILTYYSKKHLKHCLPPLISSSIKPKILIIDSSSNDGTVEEAAQFGIETKVIPQSDFNHGSTREMARHLLNTDIVVMLTPDAYASSPQMLEKLVQPLIENKASISYGRQLPHKGAGFFEAFPREFNYPPHSQLRTINDVSTYGVYTFFCSDSCAAYVNKALDEVGGFKPVLLGEDTVAAAELLHKGHAIAYVAEAQVHHSHGYTLIQEFKRYFDTGIARKTYASLIAKGGKDKARGNQFIRAMMQRLVKEKPFLIPYAVIQTFCKWLGYQLGKKSTRAPNWLKQKLSSQPYYWR